MSWRSGRERRGGHLLIGLGAIATLAGLAATITTEVVMVPTSTERTRMIALLVALGAVAVTVTFVLRLFAPRSLTRRMLLASLSGPVVVAIAVSAGSQSMFLNDHDLQFLLILLAFATVLAVGVVHALARPLADDIAALTEVAKRVGDGDLDARAELERIDEVGDLAGAIDSMVEQISSSRSERDASERERSITMASLSHDARTPLTSMRLATEALIDGVAADPDRYLRTIAADIESVETLLDDLFTLGQLEAGRLVVQPTNIDAVPTIHQVVECLSPIAADRKVALQVEGAASVPTNADEQNLHRALLNVVSNAVRFSPDGESVTLSVDGPTRTVTVADRGEGFPADFVEDAFQPFRRHDEARARAHGGAGLGLAIARGLIEALGGKIWAEPGPGGTVHIALSKPV